jgi:UDP-N-acetylglucosamine diphosphorylase/glucosamine-1-phosphate N-acetyltransferase
MSYILQFFDDAHINGLYPLTLTRPAASLRIGILTIAEKWARLLGSGDIGYKTLPYLQDIFPEIPGADFEINGRLLPNPALIKSIRALEPGQSLSGPEGVLLARRAGTASDSITFTHHYRILNRPYDIFSLNHEEILHDFAWITAHRSSAILDDSNRVIGTHPVFLEEGARAYCSIFNTTEGPVYLAADSEVMEGCMVRGPFALGEHSQLKMGARIYTGTTIGPHCKIGGEVSNSVIYGFTNKAHEGFLGNSVIGAWCNLGADTNNSNLKNNYDEVKLWHNGSKRFEKTGLQFCGLIMGDHSKSGINTMFNTGTVVGIACNVFGSGFPRNYIPDFAWGGSGGFATHRIQDALATARRVMARRKMELSEADERALHHIFNEGAAERFWETRY